MRRAKIVCTLGPAVNTRDAILRLAQAGMDVARLNFSHGTFDEHRARMQQVREVARELRKPIAVLQDLPGPKIRIGEVVEGRVHLRANHPVQVAMSAEPGTAERLTTDYPHLCDELQVGERILLCDGLVELKVLALAPGVVDCRVIKGGALTSRKGMNFPSAGQHQPALTEDDRAAIAFGVAEGVDYMALSFVRRAEDLIELRALLTAAGAAIPIIAKLEKPQAIANLGSLLAVSDAVMVARGDLGVEMPPAEVPILQKHILKLAQQSSVPAIVATQMLESMTHSPRPTRAEASDVANAVLDGADAVMLSEETAVGEYPVETVEMMAEIIRVAEREPRTGATPLLREDSLPQAVCNAASQVAAQLRAKFVCTFTESGGSARLLSQLRPQTPILAFTPHRAIARQLALFWGVRPLLLPPQQGTDAMIEALDTELLARKLVQPGDLLVVVCGAPVSLRGSTNLLKVHRAGAKDLG